ncbi:MAG TPA: lasso peptide biosynthesis B2 protein [Vicinamibacterales bacterium]|nr:lasso peptide biosynthesis B2 protein [Vicinamibacterales bacterium]
MIVLYRRFRSLDRSRRRLVVEAAASMAVFRLGLHCLRFLTLRRIADRYVALTTTTVAAEPAGIDRVRWAITAAAAHLPSATCLVRALAADAMLRRRRIPAELRFGVRADRENGAPIEGHAWIVCGDGLTIGLAEHEAGAFAELTPTGSR